MRPAAELFADKGAEVVIVARRADLLQEVADRITAAGGAATAVPCDLSDLDAVDALRGERRRYRHPGQQRRPLDPAAAGGVTGPLA